MKRTLRVIDSISEWSGKVARWLSVILVAIITYEVIMRYVFTAPTFWVFESSMMVGAVLYVLGFSYVHRHRGHIRVDVLYERLSLRGKAIIDAIGTLLLFFPLLIAIVIASVTNAWESWLANEKMIETYWYPPIAPLKTVVVIGFSFMLLQTVAQFVRDSYVLIRNKPYD